MKLKFDSMFSIKGHGTVLSGIVEEGEISITQRISLQTLTSTLDVKVKGVEVDREIVPTATQGQRVAVFLGDVDLSSISDGYKILPEGGCEIVYLEATKKEQSWWKFW